MHIAFLTPEYPHSETLRSGGLGTSIKNLVNSLITNGITVSVFIYDQKNNKQFQEDGIYFHFIKKKRYQFLGWYYYRKHIQNYINHHILKNKIDLLEAPDWTGITAFMGIKCPVIIRLNGSDAYFCHLEGRNQKLKNFLFEYKALKGAKAIVSVSEFTAVITSKIFGLKAPIPVIPNSLDVNKFIPSVKPVIKNQLLYFGTIIRKKGVLELAGIFNYIVKNKPESKLFFIGKDVVDIFQRKSTLELFREKLSLEAQKQFLHIPEVSYEEITNYIGEAEIILLPSFAEALPMTWLEAMSMEKPLVTSNIGWAKEVMLDETTGFIEDPKNNSAFAKKVLILMEDPERAIKMGKAARKQVENKFSTREITAKNILFYKSVIFEE